MGSYAYGRERTRDRLLAIGPILLVNLSVIALGWAVSASWSVPAIQTVQWLLTPVLGVGWFTLWVALHLAASDLLPIWRRRIAEPSLARM
jgi:hypothetical protein